ncbi:MAG: hypothetical protein Q4F72_05460 [Desulfovibrionaceae bacterium]|nr:hypothetical protein [Desulfovibrionaceae bacterium]
MTRHTNPPVRPGNQSPRRSAPLFLRLAAALLLLALCAACQASHAVRTPLSAADLDFSVIPFSGQMRLGAGELPVQGVLNRRPSAAGGDEFRLALMAQQGVLLAHGRLDPATGAVRTDLARAPGAERLLSALGALLREALPALGRLRRAESLSQADLPAGWRLDQTSGALAYSGDIGEISLSGAAAR